MVDRNHVIHSVPIVPKDISTENRIDWITANLKRFCVLPWLNLNTNPNGNVKLCCSISLDHFVREDKIFNLGYDDIETIWNNAYMDNVRRLHRQNNGSGECFECFKVEKVSGYSPRKGQNVVWMERKNKNKDISDYLEKVSDEKLYAYADQLPISLELRLGNQCNLKCVSCWGMSSSLIQEERKNIIQTGILKSNNLEWLHDKYTAEVEDVEKADVKEWYETETFYNNFKKMAPRLQRLYTTGGEPTLIKANYRMLEELVAANNTNCRIEFTSNMTTWNPKFYEALSKFENVEIQMSIDGVRDVAEYIRYGTEWDKVRENVIKVASMAAERPGWKVVVYTVLQALNYRYITDIWDFLNEAVDKSKKELYWWPITLSHPNHLSLAALPVEQRLTAIPRIKESVRKYTKEDTDKLEFKLGQDAIGALIDSLTNTAYDESLSKRFNDYKQFLNKYRAQQHG